ncbi:MAG: hypothetical protein P4L74_07495 [Candidatus Doudnabacteria bacterium]|nr:hypothetical protein [Candidatus Doudnabacteria bacterium]
MKNTDKKQRGYSTIEIMICLALVSLFIFGAVELVFGNQEIQVDAQNDGYGLRLSREGIETALAQGFDFVPTADVTDGNFTEHVQADWLAGYAKEITSSASFVSSGRPRKTELHSLVVDMSGDLGRDSCSFGFSGSWLIPKLRGAVSVGPGNPATDADALNGKVFLAANGSTASLPDFFVIDAGNPDNPMVLASLNTGPGINSLHVAGDYAFAANSSINGQLQIIKISDSLHPVVMLNVKLADAQSGGVGNSIFYYEGRVYVGTPKNDGPEFFVYDVQHPLAPIFLGEFEIGSQVNKIFVYGDYAYVATGDINRLRILNISDAGHITEDGDFSDVGGTAQSGESVSMLGGLAVFGRAGGLPGDHIPELYLLDVNTPATIAKLNSGDINMSVNDIFLRGGLAFLATNKSGGQFEIYDYSSGLLNFLSSSALGSDATGLDCDGQNMFVATIGDPALQIFSAQ